MSGNGETAGERIAREARRFGEVLRRTGLTPATAGLFRRIVLSFYRRHGRSLPWRAAASPYEILVSEFMLQQTQVQRVEGKYGPFLERFPGFASLAAASLPEVLACWQGLGYNRRAKALREAARAVVGKHGGTLPSALEELTALPGVGRATAGAVRAFAFGLPTAFIETNIRRVYLHFFFPRGREVTDGRILPLVEETVDRKDPKRWYWALMDCGSALGRSPANPNRRSAHYRRQSPFEGSDRQVRSAVLRLLLESSPRTAADLVARLAVDASRFDRVLEGLAGEGFVERDGEEVALAEGPPPAEAFATGKKAKKVFVT